MMQSQILWPSEVLRPFVHHYWVMQADASLCMELKIMPMGCMKWMFHRGIPFNQTAIRCIEQFILHQLHRRDDVTYLKQFITLAQAVELHPDLSLSGLADSACLSERQLRRVFSEYIGLSPKQMLRIRRCLAASRMMQQVEVTDLADIIYQLGFTDHSHLYKEFKLFAGLSPTDYLGHLQRIRSEHLLAGYRAYHG